MNNTLDKYNHFEEFNQINIVFIVSHKFVLDEISIKDK
jgi:hypothetical protein